APPRPAFARTTEGAMTDNTNKQALVLRATGGIGGAVADPLLADGWPVAAVHRDPAPARPAGDGYDWVKRDARVEAAVVAAAQACSVIVHGVTPPGYRNWAGLQLPMIHNSIAAAKAFGARILFPGTVYNYGDDAFPTLTEASPQTPS